MPRHSSVNATAIRRGTRLHKYRIEKRLGEGRFATVYRAYDTLEGRHVALKLFAPHMNGASQTVFRHEARVAASLEHKNIVRLKTAEIVGSHCLLVSELGERTLADALERPRSVRFAIQVLHQVLQGLAYAHQNGIIHRDVKPENILVWRDGRVKIADFGVSRLAEMPSTHTTATGTPSYRAPEQAYGRPTFASDVFATSLVFYEMVTRVLPRWPFQWPFERHEVFAKRVPASFLPVMRRAASFDLKRRYPDAGAMLTALRAALPELATTMPEGRLEANGRRLGWQEYRRREFAQRYGKRLALDYRCYRCSGPISEFMTACPWCDYQNNSFHGITTFPRVCAACEHGVHLDWRFCPWCYGAGFRNVSAVPSRDDRYGGQCPNPRCRETRLMPHMKHCPWCNARLRAWRSRLFAGRCPSCLASVASDYWDYCAWCARDLARTTRPRRSGS